MTADVGSLRVGLSLDSAQFTQSLASVERNVKALGQEMSIIRARGNDWGNSTEGLRTKQNTLSTLLQSQRVKVSQLNEAYQRAVTEQGANSAAAQNLAIRLNRATAEMTRTETELTQVNEELQRQQDELAETESAWNQLSTQTAEVGEQLTATGEKMIGVGKVLSTYLTAPILAVGAASVHTAAEFEAQMSRVGAIAGATGDDMSKLTEVALELGSSTSKSASEVAIGMENMAAMGFSVNDVIGAMPGVIAAAEASGSDMAQTADVMASSLNIFGLEATDATKVADILAKTANISAASLTDMQYALKYAGPPAKALGMTLEETSAAIGIMTNAGMDGSSAGTTLRGALLSLLNPSNENSKAMVAMGLNVQDAGEDFVGLSGLIENLQTSMEGQTETQKAATLAALVGKEAVSGMLSLMAAGPDVIDDMTKSLEESGGASAFAAAQMKDNLKGTLDELGGTIETAAITIGTALIPTIREAGETVTELIGKFQDMSPEAQESAIKMAALAAAIGPVVVAGGFLASGLGAIATFAAPLITTLGTAGLGGVVASLVTPIGLATVGITGLTLAVGAGVLAYKESQEINIEAIETKQKEIAKNDELIESFNELREKNKLSNEQMLRYLDINAELEMTNAPEKVAALKEEQAKLLEKSTLTNDEMDNFLGLNQKVIETAPETVKAISSEGEAFATNTIALKELNAEKAKELQNAAYETVTKALEKEASLREENIKLIETSKKAEESLQANKQLLLQSLTDIKTFEANILDLQEQKNGASFEEGQILDSKIRQETDNLLLAKSQNSEAERKIETYGKQYDKREKALEQNRKELRQLEEAQFKYEEIILAQVGITAEKGRGGVQLSEELNKLDAQKVKLKELLSSGKINTSEYQEQNGKIDTQINKLEDAKAELKLINDVAGKTVYKDVNIRENPRNFWDTLDKNLRREVTKTVSIKYNNMNGPQDPGMYATGTRYAPGGLSWVGEEGPELMYLPTGARIMPSDDSQKLLNKWNIPSETSSSNGVNAGNSNFYQASVVQNFLTTNHSPSEIARKTKQAQRQMAVEWGY